MDADLGTIVHRMERRKGNAAKWSLKSELLQYKDAEQVKRRLPDEWRQFLYEQIGLKKSSLFSGVQVYREFGSLLLVPVDGEEGDSAWDVPCEYASIPSSSLKLLLKVAKGTADDVKEEYLRIAASLSFTDFKKYVAEKEGKEVCDCTGRPVQKIVWCCPDCGKRVKSEEPGGDS
jgi:hypothetical protein